MKYRTTKQCPSKTFKAWVCQCDCGNLKTIVTSSIGRKTNSCGCIRKEVCSKKSTKDPNAWSDKYYKSKWYRAYLKWRGMLSRCEDESNKDFSKWGGRGIKVCAEWHDYEKYKSWLIANGYTPEKSGREQSVDRINVNGNYEPQNCRLANDKIQANNRTNTLIIKHHGRDYTAAEVADIAGISVNTLYGRKIRGWSDDELFQPQKQHFERNLLK